MCLWSPRFRWIELKMPITLPFHLTMFPFSGYSSWHYHVIFLNTMLFISVTAQRSWQTAGKWTRRQWWNQEPQVVQVCKLEETGGPADPAKLPAECCWQDLHCKLWWVLDEHACAWLSSGQPCCSQQQLCGVQLCEARTVPPKAESPWLKNYFRDLRSTPEIIFESEPYVFHQDISDGNLTLYCCVVGRPAKCLLLENNSLASDNV